MPRLLIQSILQAKDNAIFHFGVVCSSWVSICRHSSGRTFLAPLGYQDNAFVASGNVMMGRRGNEEIQVKVHHPFLKVVAAVYNVS